MQLEETIQSSLARPPRATDTGVMIYEKGCSRAQTPRKEGGSQAVAGAPANFNKFRETCYISRASDNHVLSTDNFMFTSDCDIPSTQPVSLAPSRIRGSETYDDAADAVSVKSSRPNTPSTRSMGVCTISQENAVIIFLAGRRHGSIGSRGKLSDSLSKEFGITPKAVRDIWNLRTWVRATRPHWTPLDEDTFMNKKSKSGAEFCNSKRKPTRQPCHETTSPKSSNHFDGEWMIEPSLIANDFKAVLMQLHECCGAFTANDKGEANLRGEGVSSKM
jgi:hypothetical protein